MVSDYFLSIVHGVLMRINEIYAEGKSIDLGSGKEMSFGNRSWRLASILSSVGANSRNRQPYFT